MIIMEYANNGGIDYHDLYKKDYFTDYDVRLYFYKLLEALDYANSKGIMHRDIKPNNFVINQKEKSLKLFDFGLGDYYFPGTDYSLHIASRHYKSPELYLGIHTYHYS